jgi:AraC-like DNA-binding protein
MDPCGRIGNLAPDDPRSRAGLIGSDIRSHQLTHAREASREHTRAVVTRSDAERALACTRWRMTIAAQRLRDDGAAIADLAQSVGYANPVAFSKAFARLQGVGPGTFRRTARRPARTAR